MKITVVGASGLIGTKVVELLKEGGNDRTPEGPRALRRLRHRLRRGHGSELRTDGALSSDAKQHLRPGRAPAGGDLDCEDIGQEVSIGASDPHRLDADHDGIGSRTGRWMALATGCSWSFTV